ncbi:MAG: 16S rRNA processing protein RimM [Firmicutes bacterium]|nr:16S rRNA processing protein RimM [Bacillota bacterium]
MLVIGEIVGAHGVRGDIKIYPLTDFPERFLEMDALCLRAADSKITEFELISARLHKNVIIVHLKGVDDRNAAEALRGREAVVPYEDAVPLPAGKWYIYQLIGARVSTEDGSTLGTITEVFSLPANDVFQVEAQGKRYLIPALKEVVLRIDVDSHEVIVRLQEGMLE